MTSTFTSSTRTARYFGVSTATGRLIVMTVPGLVAHWGEVGFLAVGRDPRRQRGRDQPGAGVSPGDP
jgi:hypothetical protein